MFSIWFSSLLVLSVNIIIAANLRCNEDIHGSFQVIENCRACVIFIAPATLISTTSTTTTTTTASTALPRHIFASNSEPSIEELFLFDERKRRRRRRHNLDTVIHQQCARDVNGPLYGYDQTHCYCNSNQCNSNIQRCIYEVTSKRHFACYHGSNSSQFPLEIRHKCRSCRIHIEFHSVHHYECLTFGEREQNNQTHCTCQQPMCNQDVSTCYRSQQLSSQPRAHPAHGILISSTASSSTTTTTTTTTTESTSISTTSTTTIATTTTSTTTTTTTTTPLPSTTSITTTTMTTTTPLITSENLVTTSSTIVVTEEEISTENTTIIQLTTINETTTSFMEIKHLKTVYIQMKNQEIPFHH